MRLVTQGEGSRLHIAPSHQIRHPRDEEILYEDQVTTQQCYLATISTKEAMKEMQLVKKEHEVLEDVGRNLEAKSLKT